MKNINWKSVLERALWTFVEGFLVALPITFSLNIAAWKSALVGAAMAGLSAVKSFFVELVRGKKIDETPKN